MKKLLVVLLSLGLIVAFSATASAVDVKFSGMYFVSGVYDDNTLLADSNVGYSRAYFFQRLRLQTDFEIAKGLTFTTRFDANEKQWGNTNWKGGYIDTMNSRAQVPVAGTPRAQESIEFERTYLTFMTAIGRFQVGYAFADAWGTAFADTSWAIVTKPGIEFSTKMGPLEFGGRYVKEFEADTSATAGYIGTADADADVYYLGAGYKFKGGEAGLQYKYYVGNTQRLAATPYRTRLHGLDPYVKATFGPIYVEAEVIYAFGTSKEFETGGTDVKRDGWGAYAKAQANLGPAFFGVLGAWDQGDDASTTDKDESGPGAGSDLNPALVLMNFDLGWWGGGERAGNTTNATYHTNILLFNFFGGFNVSPKLKLESSVTYARKDKVVAAANFSEQLGWEFDMKATYKLYDNLSYMVGAGYLWSGDYFRGASSANQIGNDYVLMNKLTLSF